MNNEELALLLKSDFISTYLETCKEVMGMNKRNSLLHTSSVVNTYNINNLSQSSSTLQTISIDNESANTELLSDPTSSFSGMNMEQPEELKVSDSLFDMIVSLFMKFALCVEAFAFYSVREFFLSASDMITVSILRLLRSDYVCRKIDSTVFVIPSL
jgi:hypothetical protein